MKINLFVFIVAFSLLNYACSDVNSNAIDLKVDFSWEGMARCGMGIPEISIQQFPKNTKFILVRMYDHAYLWDHGEVKVAYDGSNMIAKSALENIESPCPPDAPGRYEVTVKALDGNDVVLGVGSKERYFPEEN